LLRGHRHLAKELERALVVEADRVPKDVVTMNSRVRYADTTTGQIHDVTIVFPKEADSSRKRLSVLSTVGTALLGLAVGDEISWPFPDGSTRTLRVLKLLPG
jgi:regulator of nucleoside diphosphate kinase